MSSSRPKISEMIERLNALSTVELSDVILSSDSLLAVVQADSAGLKARLFACDILLRRDQERFLNIIGKRIAAGLYASALQERTTTDLNPWAYLGMDDLGPMGLHLVACGDSAVPALTPLLAIKQLAGVYSGSAEAKLGDGDYARICDFAAFFISKIKRFPYSFHHHNIPLRDAEIEQLKEKLQRPL